jgi:GNAT superfamily N-acetyltransferase
VSLGAAHLQRAVNIRMLTITTCRTLADFEAVHPLIAEMGAWDAREAAAWGIPPAQTIADYYSDTPADMLAQHTASRSAYYLARWHGTPAGGVGFVRWNDEIAEEKKFYVQPAFRGNRIGRALIETVLSGMRQAGYREACLVTTRFMPTAVSLYERVGFVHVPPFEPIPDEYVPFTLFMRLKL